MFKVIKEVMWQPICCCLKVVQQLLEKGFASSFHNIVPSKIKP